MTFVKTKKNMGTTKKEIRELTRGKQGVYQYGKMASMDGRLYEIQENGHWHGIRTIGIIRTKRNFIDTVYNVIN